MQMKLWRMPSRNRLLDRNPTHPLHGASAKCDISRTSKADSPRKNRIRSLIPSCAVLAVLFVCAGSCPCQTLTVDGESGMLFQPSAGLVPSSPGHLGGLTAAFHAVDLSPYFGNAFTIGVEEGFGRRLEFGYTRAFHTDGGNASISPLVNYNGMNLFNVKLQVIKGGYKSAKWVPAVAVGGVLRTNDGFINKYVSGSSKTNGDVFGVGSEFVPLSKHVTLILNGGVRGTNAETYGYDGNASNFQARGFGTVGLGIAIKKYVLAPAVEVDQQPHRIKYVPASTWPTTEAYALEFGPANSKWTYLGGMVHVAGRITPEYNLKGNNVIGFGVNYRF